MTAVGYEMEELVPIVGKLAARYAAGESTSLTYERAEQLMEAVLYCIHELEQCGGGVAVCPKELSAQCAYEMGAACVEKKVKRSLALYHEILADFRDYGNECLHDTFLGGLPEFFRRYDILFEPQNTILTLDYPVLRDLPGDEGVDRIYEFIACVRVEQEFLGAFPEAHVRRRMLRYDSRYKNGIVNLCEIVFLAVAGHILAEKPLTEAEFEEKDYLKLRRVFAQTSFEERSRQVGSAVRVFAQRYCEGGDALAEYLGGAIAGIDAQLKNAAEHGSLRRIL